MNMDKVILIKYGELSTKKGNRNFFINTLYKNIEKKLENYHVTLKKDRSHMYIEFLNEEFYKIKGIIDKIFGIHKYILANIVENDLEKIKENVLSSILENHPTTFKIETKRSNKEFPITSCEMNNLLGGYVLKNVEDIKVDVHNPEMLVKVEIREKNTYVYSHEYMGSGGYPVGTQGMGLLMLSGGIDSPVAGYMAMKRGIKLECVYFEAIPHTSLEARNKVIELTRILSNYTNSINLHIVNFTKIQEEIYRNCRSDYCITIMRRMMYRIMDKISKKYKGYVIINGESIGQVASQTLTSMSVINSVTNVPVIRPVACLDKLEIISIARKIGTYETSILPYEDCCTVFVPKHPVINPKLEVAIKEEEKFDYESLIDLAIENIDTLKIDSKEEKFSDLL